VWSDVILSAERQHLLRLLAWSGLSIVSSTALFTLLVARRAESALLKHFAMQTLIWSIVIAAFASAGWFGLHLRDLAGATTLERRAWLNVGLDAGYIGIGATLAACGQLLGRRMAVVGAGTAIVIQGLALFLLDLQFAALVSR